MWAGVAVLDACIALLLLVSSKSGSSSRWVRMPVRKAGELKAPCLARGFGVVRGGRVLQQNPQVLQSLRLIAWRLWWALLWGSASGCAVQSAAGCGRVG